LGVIHLSVKWHLLYKRITSGAKPRNSCENLFMR
jgi:hypothetical protein